MRFDYQPFKNGQPQDAGSFRETDDCVTGFPEAQRQALLLCWEKKYEKVVVSLNGKRLCVVNDDGKISYWDD
jgi:hypothetical protein